MIRITSLNLVSGDRNVVVNDDIDLSSVRNGYTLDVDGLTLPVGITSGGYVEPVYDNTDPENPVLTTPGHGTLYLQTAPTISLATREAVIIFTQEVIADLIEQANTLNNQITTVLNSIGAAAEKGVQTSSTDTTTNRTLLTQYAFAGDSNNYHANGNGVTAGQAATAIKGAKDGCIGSNAGKTTTTWGSETLNSFLVNGSVVGDAPSDYCAGLFMSRGGGEGIYIVGKVNTDEMWAANKVGGTLSDWRLLLHSYNTAVDGSGFIKAASPIVKLFSDDAVFNNQCPDDAVFEKVGVGHYLIKNTLGLAKNGWWIETPTDTNKNVKFYTEWSQLEDNTIEIKTFEPVYTNGVVGGTVPVDITEGRWIDLRLEPEPVVELEEETE
jgi:hypothetical protein